MEAITKPILLIGESCVDICLYGEIVRLNPEAPTPVMSYEHEHRSMGMSSNVQSNLMSLSLANTSVRHICNEREITKTRFIDKKYGYILLRLDRGDSVPPCGEDVIQQLSKEIKAGEYSALAISDYNKGFVSAKDIETLSIAARDANIFSFLDTKKNYCDELSQCMFAKVNESEYLCNGWSEAKNNWVIETLGERGAVIRKLGAVPYPVETTSSEIVNASGAGDTFFAALILGTLWKNSLVDAVKYANRAAGVAVSKSGVVSVSYKEIGNE